MLNLDRLTALLKAITDREPGARVRLAEYYELEAGLCDREAASYRRCAAALRARGDSPPASREGE